MTAYFKVISSLLVLALIITLVQSAPADKNSVEENAAGSASKLSNQGSEEQVTKSNRADTRVDAPASSGANAPVNKPPASIGTFFDSIFNIPTSVLRAVNQFLNNNIKFGQGQSSKTAAPGSGSNSATADVTTSSSVTDGVSESPKNSTARATTFFDNIFNIPITAINSVNSLITGRKTEEHAEVLSSKNNN